MLSRANEISDGDGITSADGAAYALPAIVFVLTSGFATVANWLKLLTLTLSASVPAGGVVNAPAMFCVALFVIVNDGTSYARSSDRYGMPPVVVCTPSWTI